jgi:tetratricopeptide (TPR) repeat protein
MKPLHSNPKRILLVAAICLVVASGIALPVAAQAQRGQRAAQADTPAEAELQKGIALTRSGKFEEAIPHFLAARGQVADEYAVSFNLALCYFATGRYPPAIALLDGLRSSGRATAEVENLLALALLGRGQPDEAFAAFQRAVRLSPKNEKLYLYMAEACMDNGYYDHGLKAVELGLQKIPRSARLRFERGLLLVKFDRLDEAKQELQKVAEIAPGSDVAYIASVQNHLFEGNVAEAVRVARRGMQSGQRHFMLLSLFGEAVLRSGSEPGSAEFAEARAALERAAAERPNYVSARIALGKLYLLESRLDDAINQLSAARELDPQNAAVYSNLAVAYRRQGAIERAEQMLAILARLNELEVERIRTAPGDRKAGYTERRRPPRQEPPSPEPRDWQR